VRHLRHRRRERVEVVQAHQVVEPDHVGHVGEERARRMGDDQRIRLRLLRELVDERQEPMEQRDAPGVAASPQARAGGRLGGEVNLQAIGIEAVGPEQAAQRLAQDPLIGAAGRIGGHGASERIGDAGLGREALRVPGLEPEQHALPCRVAIGDPAAHVGPAVVVRLVAAVRRLPAVVDHDRPGHEPLPGQRGEPAVVEVASRGRARVAAVELRVPVLLAPPTEDGPRPPLLPGALDAGRETFRPQPLPVLPQRLVR
jgi:hypothetical protein